MLKTKQVLFTILTLFWVITVLGQNTVTGLITDSDGSALPGVNITEADSSNGSISDFDGNYTIEVQEGASLIFSFVGFEAQKIPVNGQSVINVTLSAGEALEDIVLVGSRAPVRSKTTVALPIDVVGSEDLVNTGQATFDKALQYRIPSFNTVQTPVNDATSLLDPYEIRNMGPSRTLILINGKRKNLSALLYTQTSPGRGETGADISAIPTDAIKRVEILRDGASAQYGSDAIAGVMNIILKDNPSTGSATIRSGITSEGDGEMFGLAVNNGTSIGDDKGFINYTIDLSKVNLANRPGTVDADGEFSDFVFQNPESPGPFIDRVNNTLGGVDISGLNGDQLQAEFDNNYVGSANYNTLLPLINDGNTRGRAYVEDFLNNNPDGNNVNGVPETAAAKFLLNGGYNLSDESELYFNAAYVYKNVNSFANYRVPYWRRSQQFFPNEISGVNYYPYLNDFFGNGTNDSYQGYAPTFDGLLSDYNGTIGFRTKKNDWNIDLSFTIGGNLQTYKVRNSHNRNAVFEPVFNDANGNGVVDPGEGFSPTELYRQSSPIDFDPGGTRFSHNVGNIDISRILNDYVSIAFGAEFRTETFEIIEGGLASYDGGGADSFAGNTPENSGKFNRYNIGGYLDLAFDITEDFLINTTGRIEEYSDFGRAIVGKVSGRYNFLDDKLTLRASASTGFRAPTLHQIFTQKAQFAFIPGQGVQVGGFVNNVSPQARLLGLDALDAEESTNFTVGIGSKITNNFNVTVDYYNIAVKDRIVLGSEVAPPDSPVFEGFSDLSFFANAIDTRTSGIDVVIGYNNVAVGDGQLGFNLSGNYTLQNEREGEVNDPDFLNENESIVNDTQEALFFTSRPIYKAIFGIDYNIGKFNIALNNTLFGPTEFRNQGLQDLEGLFNEEALVQNNIADTAVDGTSDLKVVFMPKVVTDLSFNFEFTESLNITLNVNNLLNVLPEWEFESLTPTGNLVLNSPAELQTTSNLITFNQRYSQMTYDGSHFSQLGTMFNLAVNYKF